MKRREPEAPTVFPLLVALLVVFLGCGNRGQRKEVPPQHQAGTTLSQAPARQPSGRLEAKQGGAAPDPAPSPHLSRDSNAEMSAALPDSPFPFGKPSAGEPPPDAVPFDTIRAVALSTARQEGMFRGPPESRARGEGPAIPYVDFEGKTTAYVFNFRIDGKSFPSNYEQVARDILEDQAHYPAAGRIPPKKVGNARSIAEAPGRIFADFRYAFVLVSATYTSTPLVAFGNGVSEFYTQGEKVLQKARELLSVDRPTLKRIYSGGDERLYEFEGGGRSVVIPAFAVSLWEDASAFRSETKKLLEDTRARSDQDTSGAGSDREALTQQRLRKARAEWDKILRQSDQ